MNNFNPPKDFKQSIRQQQLTLAFREMYLLVRALHIQTEPGSVENLTLELFFGKIMDAEWTDEDKVEKLLKNCQKMIGELFGDNKKETILKEPLKVPRPLKTTTSPSIRKKSFVKGLQKQQPLRL